LIFGRQAIFSTIARRHLTRNTAVAAQSTVHPGSGLAGVASWALADLIASAPSVSPPARQRADWTWLLSLTAGMQVRRYSSTSKSGPYCGKNANLAAAAHTWAVSQDVLAPAQNANLAIFPHFWSMKIEFRLRCRHSA